MPPWSMAVFRQALCVKCESMVEGDELGGTHEGEVERVEEDDRVLAFGGLGEVELADDLAVAKHGGGSEVGGLAADENAHSGSS